MKRRRPAGDGSELFGAQQHFGDALAGLDHRPDVFGRVRTHVDEHAAVLDGAGLAQRGFNVVFIPYDAKGWPTGDWEVFADNFAGKTEIASPGDAKHRPNGVAFGPDGSLYISDSQAGRIWRIFYTGEK